MKSGLPIVMISVALIGGGLAVPAAAQSSAESPASILVPVGPGDARAERQKKAADRARRSQAIDDAYRATTGSQPDAKPKSNDPWANMR